MLKHIVHALAPVAAAAVIAGAAAAEPAPRIDPAARLHRCGAETCLLVTGRRADAAAPVLIAGRAVAVAGGRHWRAAVPLRLVRGWAAPSARTIAVAVAGERGGEAQARLPIGLLGPAVDLAFLSVTAGH